MSTGSTSPKRSFRSSLKDFFDKKFHVASNQSERSSHESGSNDSAGIQSNSQQSYESNSSLGHRHNVASTTLGGTLRALRHSAEIFPPLQAAMGTLISGLEAAAEGHLRSYNHLLEELSILHTGIDKYRNQIEFAGMSDGTANIVLSIEAEAKFLKSKRDQGRMARILNAEKDGDDLIQCYHRIEKLSRQLQ
ncbi:unnamed protein product, partial [Rhizoctonia solani]